MFVLNFSQYNKEEEKNGGDYWTFLDATSKTLFNEGIYLDKINNIIKQIINKGLQSKMKKKIYDLIMEKFFFMVLKIV